MKNSKALITYRHKTAAQTCKEIEQDDIQTIVDMVRADKGKIVAKFYPNNKYSGDVEYSFYGLIAKYKDQLIKLGYGVGHEDGVEFRDDGHEYKKVTVQKSFLGIKYNSTSTQAVEREKKAIPYHQFTVSACCKNSKK